MFPFFPKYKNRKYLYDLSKLGSYNLNKFIPYSYNQTSYTYDTQLNKYIRKIESDLLKKSRMKNLPGFINLSRYSEHTYEPRINKYFNKNNDSIDNSIIPVVGIICFLAGYNLSKISLV